MVIIERECLVWDWALASGVSGGKDCERKDWILVWRALTREARSRSGDKSGEGDDVALVVVVFGVKVWVSGRMWWWVLL